MHDRTENLLVIVGKVVQRHPREVDEFGVDIDSVRLIHGETLSIVHTRFRAHVRRRNQVAWRGGGAPAGGTDGVAHRC